MTQTSSLSKIWWLYIPFAFLAIQLLAELIVDRDLMSVMHSENGPHELLQFIVITAAFFVAAATLTRFPFKEKPWLAAWIGLAALCCLYVSGEEMSWGQQVLKWSTPEFWSHVNDQQETNLHNTSSWLDQKPRLILEIGVMVGGLLIPALGRFKPGALPQKFAMIYPTAQLVPIALIVIFLKLSNAAGEAVHLSLYARVSEVIELYLFYFTLLYLLALRKRLAA